MQHTAPKFRPSPLVAETYREPSPEAHRLLRHAPWLTSPDEGEASFAARVSLHFLVAPMTQLTFFSFDLQACLFLVFHRSPLAIFGHALFMTTENLCIMAALRPIAIAQTPLGTLNGGMIYTVILLAWYAGVAFRAGLRGWFAVTGPVVIALYFASCPIETLCRSLLDRSPLWGALLSALLVALSHSAEPLLPPRTVDPWQWTSLHTFLLGPELSLGDRALRLLRLGGILVLGTVAEAWASIRLMPYNWLMVMMRFGYAPIRNAELQQWAERAWASGNPALDFVGTGGGTFLVPPRTDTASTTFGKKL